MCLAVRAYRGDIPRAFTPAGHPLPRVQRQAGSYSGESSAFVGRFCLPGRSSQRAFRRSHMKTAKNWALRPLLAFGAALLFASSAEAAVSCHKINAKGVGQDLGGGRTQA